MTFPQGAEGLLMVAMPQGAEWLIILVLILLLFGAKRLPDAARGLGRSLRILKAETKGLHDDDGTPSEQIGGTKSPEQLPAADPTNPAVAEKSADPVVDPTKHQS